MSEPNISHVREVLKRLQWISRHGSPAQFFAFITALDFRDEFENNDDFNQNLKEIERDERHRKRSQEDTGTEESE